MAAPEALVGASAAQRMLAELNQLVYALTPALYRRGAAQRAVLLPAEPITPFLEPRGESSPCVHSCHGGHMQCKGLLLCIQGGLLPMT